MALDDPRAFLNRLPDPGVLDEVQRAPELFSYLQSRVDVIADVGTKLMPIEIKSGQTLNRDFFIGLERWSKLAGPQATSPTLI